MPDWAGHLLFALVICEGAGIREKRSLVLLGSILPDILAKIHLLGFLVPFNAERFFVFFHPSTHSLIGVLLLAGMAAGFFRYNQKKAFLLIAIGSVSHLLADFTNKFFVYGPIYAWLPFSFQSTFIGWFWSDGYIYQMLIFLIAYIAIIAVRIGKRRMRRGKRG